MSNLSGASDGTLANALRAAGHGSAARPAHRPRRVGLVAWFLILSLLSVSAVSAVVATLLARFMTESMLRHDVRLTTEFVNHMFAAEGADVAFERAPETPPPPQLARFFAKVGQMPYTLRANIYLLDGTVFWSTDSSIVGLRFADNDELAGAVGGQPQAEIGTISRSDKDEHVNLGAPGTRFVENYLPMFRDGNPTQPVVAVAEVYRTPEDLFVTLREGQLLIGTGAALGTLVIVGVLFWLVANADRVIRRQDAEIAQVERLATAGEMAAAVAHGLRNPLSAIRSSAELALRLRTPERILQLLDDIVLQSDRLDHWVRQYLRATETDDDGMCPDLRPMLAAIRASFAVQLERQGIAYDERIEPELPTIAMSPALVEQLVNGIVANAVEAMPAGGRLTLTAARNGDGMVRIEIGDTGRGMSKAQLDQAFEPFVTSKQSGLGLGLALARRIVTRHGGEIGLVSGEGRGTVVSVLVPSVVHAASRMS